MKKSLNLILILTTFFTLTSTVNAAILKNDFLKKQIQINIENCLKDLNIEKSDIKISNIPYKSIAVPDGKIEIKTNKNLKNYSCSSLLKTDILVDGVKFKSFGTNVQIKIYDKVWVVKNNLKKGATLSWSNLSLEEKTIDIFSKNSLKEDFKPTGFLTTRSLRSGTILNKKFIRKIPLVVKNSPISIIYKTPCVSITIPGMALEDGNIGDFIRVKNTQYKKNFVGKIVGNNIIKVNI